MELTPLLSELSQSVVEGDVERVKKLTQEALEQGQSVESVSNKGLIGAMTIVGRKFQAADFFLPEVLLAAQAMKAGMEILEPLLLKEGVPPKAKLVLGSVKGDIHDIGKNLVGVMMRGDGFQVIDLGIGVPPERFVDAVEETGAQLVGMSALTSGTMPAMKITIDAFVASGSRPKVKIMVGGAIVTAEYAQAIGADGYARDAVSAVAKANELLGLN